MEHLYTLSHRDTLVGDHRPGIAFTLGHCLPLDPMVVFRNIWAIALLTEFVENWQDFIESHRTIWSHLYRFLKYKVKVMVT